MLITHRRRTICLCYLQAQFSEVVFIWPQTSGISTENPAMRKSATVKSGTEHRNTIVYLKWKCYSFSSIHADLRLPSLVVFIYISLGSCILLDSVIQDHAHVDLEKVPFSIQSWNTAFCSFSFSLNALIQLVMVQLYFIIINFHFPDDGRCWLYAVIFFCPYALILRNNFNHRMKDRMMFAQEIVTSLFSFSLSSLSPRDSYLKQVIKCVDIEKRLLSWDTSISRKNITTEHI